MKKLLLSLLLAGTSFVAFAQLPTFGIKGGANFSTLHISIDGSNIGVNSGTLTSFNAGVFVDFKFGNVSLQPALNLTGKGGKFSATSFSDSESSDVEEGSGKFNLLYLQLPVNIVYHVPVIVGTSILVPALTPQKALLEQLKAHLMAKRLARTLSLATTATLNLWNMALT